MLIDHVQEWVFSDLPDGLGFDGEPTWWPVVPLLVAGLVVGATIRYLPGRGGHCRPTGSRPAPRQRPSSCPASSSPRWCRSSRCRRRPGGAADRPRWRGRGAGRPARQARRPAQALSVVGGAGSFAAVSALLGSPLLGAFLLMEVIGLGGAAATVVLLPGLLAAGIGALVFIGIGTSRRGRDLLAGRPEPASLRPSQRGRVRLGARHGVAAAVVGTAIRRLAVYLRPHVERRIVLLTPVAGARHRRAGDRLRRSDRQEQRRRAVLRADRPSRDSSTRAPATPSAPCCCSCCARPRLRLSLSSFRGGPMFPAMYIGAAGGIAMSHLPGIEPGSRRRHGHRRHDRRVLRLPLTSVLLATLLLGPTASARCRRHRGRGRGLRHLSLVRPPPCPGLTSRGQRTAPLLAPTGAHTEATTPA